MKSKIPRIKGKSKFPHDGLLASGLSKVRSVTAYVRQIYAYRVPITSQPRTHVCSFRKGKIPHADMKMFDRTMQFVELRQPRRIFTNGGRKNGLLVAFHWGRTVKGRHLWQSGLFGGGAFTPGLLNPPLVTVIKTFWHALCAFRASIFRIKFCCT